jgi:hypothetical protein
MSFSSKTFMVSQTHNKVFVSVNKTTLIIFYQCISWGLPSKVYKEYTSFNIKSGSYIQQYSTSVYCSYFDAVIGIDFLLLGLVTHYNLTLSYPTVYLNLMHCGRCVHQLMLIGTEQWCRWFVDSESDIESSFMCMHVKHILTY